jgi:hypothetical protein
MDSGHGSSHDDAMTKTTTAQSSTQSSTQSSAVLSAQLSTQSPTHSSAPGPTTRATEHSDCERKLRVVLRLNATNSFVFGALLAAFPAQVDDLLDTGHPGWIRLVGLGLLPFGALCTWLSTASPPTLRRITPQIVVGDVAWVAASVATVLLGWYSGGGIFAVLAMAAIIDAFALLQWTAWRRLQATH